MTTKVASKVFPFSPVAGGEKTRSIEFSLADLDSVLDGHVEQLRNGYPAFNAGRMISQELIDYAIQEIEDTHESRAKKSERLLKLCFSIYRADFRHQAENVRRAVNFLHDNACLIGAGIVSDLKNQNIDGQIGLCHKFVDILFKVSTGKTLPVEQAAIELLDVYSCYLADYFRFGEANYDMLDKQAEAAKSMMALLRDLNLETPDYLVATRAKLLKGFARDAFDIVSNPTQQAVSRLFAEFEKCNFSLTSDDPVAHAMSNGERELLVAKYNGGHRAYIFHSPDFSLVARTERELLATASRVIGNTHETPSAHIQMLLNSCSFKPI